MVKIVIFGDSNTWGFDPRNGLARPDRFVRLFAQWHPEWTIVDDGLNGRLMASDDPYFGDIDGSRQLCAFLKRQVPYDLLVIALGANDARRMFHASLAGWSQAFEKLVKTAVAANRNAFASIGDPHTAPIVFVEPPAFGLDHSKWSDGYASYGESGIQILSNCHYIMKQTAEKYGCQFLDVQKKGVKGGAVDGIHLDSEGHQKMAQCLGQWIEKQLAEGKIA